MAKKAPAALEHGFTLLEVLLSLAIVGVLAGLSLPVYQSFNNRNALDISTEGIATALRRAQTYARANQGDSIWGVRIQNSEAVLFKGSTYAARDTSYDEPVTIPANITVSGGLVEVAFSKLFAVPSATGSALLTSSNNDIRTITLNSEGMVSY